MTLSDAVEAADPSDVQDSHNNASPVLAARAIEKRFGKTHALAGAQFTLREGEIHALLGANGAGKSTLSKIISGHLIPDSGVLEFRGQPLSLRSTREAMDTGISIVMQETTLAPDMSVLENIFLPELGRAGRLSYRRMRDSASSILATLGRDHALPLDAEVSNLSAAERQLVEIAKALALNAELIIFDEPTASLSPGEVDRLFQIMASLKTKGHSLVFVSHRLEEVFQITDRVTIMREGSTVENGRDTDSLTQSEIIRAMVGRDIGAIYETPGLIDPGSDQTPEILRVDHLATTPRVRDVSFAVRRGEILGLGGLVGAGRSETAEALFGLRKMSNGHISLHGRPVTFPTPRHAIRAGIGFVPEDRQVQNIVPDLSVRENLLLAHLAAHRGFGLGRRAIEGKVDSLLEKLGLPAHRLLDASMLDFSGGMQQKIIIARWLLLEPDVLILDEPTKGVDIGTRQSIYRILQEIAADGVAVVVISSDFEELLGISNRIVVISDGYSIAEVPSAALDEEKLTLLAAPRTSMRKTNALLELLAAEHDGHAFWATLDEASLICLSIAGSNTATEPGFTSGEAIAFNETRIPSALTKTDPCFVRELTDVCSTLMLPVHNSRGHELGHVGLVVTGPTDAIAVSSIQRRIEALNA